STGRCALPTKTPTGWRSCPTTRRSSPSSMPLDLRPCERSVTMTIEEQNRAIAMRYYNEIMNQGNLATIDELMSPDFLFTIPTHPEPFRGPEGFKQLVTMLRGAFPDMHLSVEHLLVEGDTVVGHWTGQGTHTGGKLHTV